MNWGDKGCAYRPDLCDHEPDDGCMYCCMQCNEDRHLCPNCGTISDHRETPCSPCINHRTGELISDHWLRKEIKRERSSQVPPWARPVYTPKRRHDDLL